MWIWLTISMLLVVACIIFGIYSFISSRTLQKSISAEPGNVGNNIGSRVIGNGFPVLQKQAILNLKVKLKSIEDNSLLSVYHLNELKKRIETLESANNLTAMNDEAKWDDSGEDWEKLYYEARREKQSTEDNLSTVKNVLQENINKLRELEKQHADWAAMKSDLESGINEVQSLQNIIEELKRKLQGAGERESELAQQVMYEKSKYFEHELLQKQNNQLRSEMEILTNRLEQMNEQNSLVEQKIKSLTELGSILEISEYEKMGIKNSVEQLLHKM